MRMARIVVPIPSLLNLENAKTNRYAIRKNLCMYKMSLIRRRVTSSNGFWYFWLPQSFTSLLYTKSANGRNDGQPIIWILIMLLMLLISTIPEMPPMPLSTLFWQTSYFKCLDPIAKFHNPPDSHCWLNHLSLRKEKISVLFAWWSSSRVGLWSLAVGISFTVSASSDGDSRALSVRFAAGRRYDSYPLLNQPVTQDRIFNDMFKLKELL